MKGQECSLSVLYVYQEKMATSKAGRVFSSAIYSAGTLMLDFPGSRTMEPLRLRCFVMAALADQGASLVAQMVKNLPAV